MFNTLEEQEEHIRMSLPELGISELESLLKQYTVYDAQVTDTNGERVWLYAESRQIISDELRERRGF